MCHLGIVSIHIAVQKCNFMTNTDNATNWNNIIFVYTDIKTHLTACSEGDGGVKFTSSNNLPAFLYP